jgi:hypothetical protein
MSQKCRILSAGIGRIQRPKRAQRILKYTTPRGAELEKLEALKKGMYSQLFALKKREECRIIPPS